MTRYYKIDTARLRLGEFWRSCESFPAFLFAVTASKLLRIRGRYQFGIPRVEKLDRIPVEELPAPVQRKISAMTTAFASRQFEQQFAYEWPMLGCASGHGVAFLSADGRAVGLALAFRGATPQQRNWQWICTVMSRFEDGRFWSTVDERARLDLPPGFAIERLLGQPVPALIDHHLARLAAAPVPVPAVAESAVEALIIETHHRMIDFQVSRGVYVPMTAREVNRLKAVWDDEEAFEA